VAIERFPIEAGHIMLFARAIGDMNPVFHDHETAVAPPTFIQAGMQFDPEGFLRWRPDRPWMGSAKEPSQAMARMRAQAEAAAAGEPQGGSPAGGGGGGQRSGGGGGLHAEQHFEYTRIPRPGDVLTSSVRPGERWEKEGRRGGKLVFSETITEYRDQNGELVCTARSVGVQTERVPEAN
jgi:hypothetical protein